MTKLYRDWSRHLGLHLVFQTGLSGSLVLKLKRKQPHIVQQKAMMNEGDRWKAKKKWMESKKEKNNLKL